LLFNCLTFAAKRLSLFMEYTFEQAGNLLNKISEESRGKNLTAEERAFFNEAYFKGMLEALIVSDEKIAGYFEQQLDIVRKLNKLGKL